MLMTKTNYTVKLQGETYAALKDGVIEAKGFNDVESTLKAIHVLEGSNMNHFYEEGNGIVYLKSNLVNKELTA